MQKSQNPFNTKILGNGLNRVNESRKINSARNSVPVMALLAYHKEISTPDELEKCIAGHNKHAKDYTPCRCGITSNGDLHDFTERLYAAQTPLLIERNRKKFTKQECYVYQKTLFCAATMKGRHMENMSMEFFRINYPEYRVERASFEEDYSYAVDYWIMKKHEGVFKKYIGIQVKPGTFFKRCKPHVLRMEVNKMARAPAPVLYHMYGTNNKFVKCSTENIAVKL